MTPRRHRLVRQLGILLIQLGEAECERRAKFYIPHRGNPLILSTLASLVNG